MSFLIFFHFFWIKSLFLFYLLSTTHVVRGKVMFSVMSVCLQGWVHPALVLLGGGWGYILSRSCLGMGRYVLFWSCKGKGVPWLDLAGGRSWKNTLTRPSHGVRRGGVWWPDLAGVGGTQTRWPYLARQVWSGRPCWWEAVFFCLCCCHSFCYLFPFTFEILGICLNWLIPAI